MQLINTDLKPKNEMGMKTNTPARYIRPKKQTLPNLNLESCIARTYRDINPGCVTEVMNKSCLAIIRSEGVIQTRVFNVLAYIPDVLKYDAMSIFGVSRVVNWEFCNDIAQLRAGAKGWLEAYGIYENCEPTEDTSGIGEPAQEVGPEDTRIMMSDREIEISHAINALLSGCTDVMGQEEAEGVVTCTGHLISEIFPLLLADIAATEFCLSPDFSDEEIHHVATSILDSWSDNEAKRQIVALDAITELRTELPAPAVIEKPVIKVKPRPEPEEIHVQAVHATTSPALTYRQQLTIAAIQGLCANPACFGVFDEIAEMAITLANATDRESD